MKTTFKFFTFIFCIALTACGGKQEAADKYCGKELSAFQVMDLKKIGDQGYTFSDEDNKLAADMIAALNGLYETSPEIQIGFIMKEADKIGLYVLVPDATYVEKASCYLLQNDFDGRLPKTRNLVFYSKGTNDLLAGIRSK